MEKLLSYKDLENLGLGSQITIWRKVKYHSFPKPIKLGNKANSPVRFIESEIIDWLEQQKYGSTGSTTKCPCGTK